MFHVILPYPYSIKTVVFVFTGGILNGMCLKSTGHAYWFFLGDLRTAQKDLPAVIKAFRGHLLRSVCYYCCTAGQFREASKYKKEVG